MSHLSERNLAREFLRLILIFSFFQQPSIRLIN